MTSPNRALRCRELVEVATDFLEGALGPPDRTRVEAHLQECQDCRLYLEQQQQVVRVLGKLNPVPPPEGTRSRMRELFREHCQTEAQAAAAPVRLGIRDLYGNLGDHIAYFWETESQFEEAVGFLASGLRGRDAAFVFGYDEANQKVLDCLQRRGLNLDSLQEGGRLVVLEGEEVGQQMLAKIGAAFQAAQERGAPVLRLLGNIGWGRPGWPVDDGMLEFEAKVTEAAKRFPCVVVCLYDVRSLSGRVLLKGGFESHPLTVDREALYTNPRYKACEPFLAELLGGRASDSVH